MKSSRTATTASTTWLLFFLLTKQNGSIDINDGPKMKAADKLSGLPCGPGDTTIEFPNEEAPVHRGKSRGLFESNKNGRIFRENSD